MGLVDRNNMETLGIGLAALFLILLASAWVSGLIADPLRRIARQTEAIGRFELDCPDLGQSTIKEVDQLMEATDGMKRGLRSFAKYVPSDVVREILSSGGEAEIGRPVSWWTSAGFTRDSISLSLTPAFPPDHASMCRAGTPGREKESRIVFFLSHPLSLRDTRIC
ncbi:MAG: hypothetical protein IH611_00140 [Deltaproteobacteria bacterium]|nr:hypothetical protein [Deltaproteobacteria bacterium]